MEQELNSFEKSELNYYKLDYITQKVDKILEFKKWYENAIKYIDKENQYNEHRLYTICLCKNCISYTICTFAYEYSFVKCSKCNIYFCVGCSRKKLSVNDESLCLKGYFKLLFIRTKYRKSGMLTNSDLLNFILSILIILITPCYFGFVSNIIGLNVHQNPNGVYNSFNLEYFEIIVIYSFLRGIIMFPYILIFLPFTILLLIPSIFIPKYSYKLNSLYTSSLDPSPSRLNTDI